MHLQEVTYFPFYNGFSYVYMLCSRPICFLFSFSSLFLLMMILLTVMRKNTNRHKVDFATLIFSKIILVDGFLQKYIHSLIPNYTKSLATSLIHLMISIHHQHNIILDTTTTISHIGLAVITTKKNMKIISSSNIDQIVISKLYCTY